MTYVRAALTLISCAFLSTTVPVVAQTPAAVQAEQNARPHSAADMMLDPSMSHCARTTKGCDRSDYQDAYDVDCKQGDAASCYELGQSLATTGEIRTIMGITEHEQSERAYKSFSKACALGYAQACVNQGFMMHYGIGVAYDSSEARVIFTKACASGEPHGCYNIGYMWERGFYGNSDPTIARDFYTKACDKGIARACFNLAMIISGNFSGEAERERVYAASRSLFAKACEAKLTVACNNLGKMMASGMGGPSDSVKATELFTLACKENGITRACYNLGVILYRPYVDDANILEAQKFADKNAFGGPPDCHKGYCSVDACDYVENNSYYGKDCKSLMFVTNKKRTDGFLQ